ncbi:chymotrypsin inhibitor SCI-I [Drosophila virilis]|uniref:Kunitz inhibitor like protein 2 n=1 Tax=Drosophila virilis TaxID=7244 RepID=Q9U5S5_DROVI|nr:chymotrypsin inhibitor SCI-I [Drosophila virilis]EDW68798.1 kunitz inhibitor like protein 2 [Drosophila virilis]CAB55351.1 Kunitz inhibitor like protein 2 [Drosophila virilis]
MKFFLILAGLAFYVAHTGIQAMVCRGGVADSQPVCIGGKSEGHANETVCYGNANIYMWWYDTRSRSCKRLSYNGCGGNKNRFCTKSLCKSKCRRNERAAVQVPVTEYGIWN